jgi:hypothetical protein
MKLLIIGHARHGKDTVALILEKEFGLTHLASSEASSTIFVFDALKEKYGYSTVDECFVDRVNHREEWYTLICEYNAGDQARLAKEIVKQADLYVGMRSQAELDACLEQGVFDAIIGVVDPNKPLEPKESMSIPVEEYADLIICNDGTLSDLREKVVKAYHYIKAADLIIHNDGTPSDLRNKAMKAYHYLKAKVDSRRVRQEREARLREYWNNLPKFKEVKDIPELPRIEDPEEWKSFYVVKLIEAGAIPKGLLKDGAYYLGDHRRATVAQWRAAEGQFTYMRSKFGRVYEDCCNHFEDDDGYSLFVPIMEATEEQFKRNAE